MKQEGITENINGLWKVHTSNLLIEMMNNDSGGMLKIPVNILGKLLALVGQRAIELNDPKLNRLMVLLTIYTVADPCSADYDKDVVEDILKQENMA